MKKITLFATLCVVLFAVACKKDSDEPKYSVESPIKATFDQKVVYDTIEKYKGDYEFGYKFYSSKSGQITQLGCLAPVKGNVRVSLWDFDSKDLITAVTVSSDSISFKYVDIPAVAITANKRYVVSLNSFAGGASTYTLGVKKGSSNLYPFSSGSVTFEALQQIASTTSQFPSTVVSNSQKYLGGFSDFKLEIKQ